MKWELWDNKLIEAYNDTEEDIQSNNEVAEKKRQQWSKSWDNKLIEADDDTVDDNDVNDDNQWWSWKALWRQHYQYVGEVGGWRGQQLMSTTREEVAAATSTTHHEEMPGKEKHSTVDCFN